jgi:hypothetical protein
VADGAKLDPGLAECFGKRQRRKILVAVYAGVMRRVSRAGLRKSPSAEPYDLIGVLYRDAMTLRARDVGVPAHSSCSALAVGKACGRPAALRRFCRGETGVSRAYLDERARDQKTGQSKNTLFYYPHHHLTISH